MAILIAVGLIFLLSTLFLALPSASGFQKTFASLGMPASLFILLLLVYRSPLKAARQIAGEVIKLQVVYLGYLRQVNQIDIGFKQSFVVTEKLTSKQLQETFTKTQDIIDKAMDDINLLLDDLS